MAPPKGNSFWKLRSKHGRKELFESAELLWQAACEYFEATEERTWKRTDWVGKDALPVERESITPFSIAGLCVYLDASRAWYTSTRARKEAEKADDFIEVFARIDNIMFAQKFEGAAVGFFNHSIIARDLGLAEKTDTTIASPGATGIKIQIIPPPPE